MNQSQSSHCIGVISDTHGQLRESVLEIFQGVDQIIHAGDIGNQDIIYDLLEIAPVFSVRGNMDYYQWAQTLSHDEIVNVGTSRFYVLHDLSMITFDPAESNFLAVIFGHTHHPTFYQKNGVYYINPGSAGPIRSNKPPPSIARLNVISSSIEVEWFQI